MSLQLSQIPDGRLKQSTLKPEQMWSLTFSKFEAVTVKQETQTVSLICRWFFDGVMVVQLKPPKSLCRTNGEKTNLEVISHVVSLAAWCGLNDSIHGYFVSIIFIHVLLEYQNIYSQICEIYIQEYLYLTICKEKVFNYKTVWEKSMKQGYVSDLVMFIVLDTFFRVLLNIFFLS